MRLCRRSRRRSGCVCLAPRAENRPIGLKLARLGDRDVLDHAQPDGQIGAGGDRHEHAAVLDERLQMGQPVESQTAADIVGVVDSPKVRRQLGGLEWNRTAKFGAVVEQSLANAVDQCRQTRRYGGKMITSYFAFRSGVARISWSEMYA